MASPYVAVMSLNKHAFRCVLFALEFHLMGVSK